jgi:hypothetical protein
MKTILSFSAFALFSYHCFKPTSFNSIVENCATDSSIINHVLDGSIKDGHPGDLKRMVKPASNMQ